MSARRPITAVINELRRVADELRESHTVNGKWPPEEIDTHMEYTRLLYLIRGAEKEWYQVRQELLRLDGYESLMAINDG